MIRPCFRLTINVFKTNRKFPQIQGKKRQDPAGEEGTASRILWVYSSFPTCSCLCGVRSELRVLD